MDACWVLTGEVVNLLSIDWSNTGSGVFISTGLPWPETWLLLDWTGDESRLVSYHCFSFFLKTF